MSLIDQDVDPRIVREWPFHGERPPSRKLGRKRLPLDPKRLRLLTQHAAFRLDLPRSLDLGEQRPAELGQPQVLAVDHFSMEAGAFPSNG